MDLTLPGAILLISVVSAIGKEWCAFKAGSALLLNLAINSSFVYITSIQFPWYFFGSIDYLTAIGILGLGQTRWSIAIVVLYAVEMLAHSAFAYSNGGPWPQYRYFWLLYYVAWAQTLLLGGWCLYGLVQSHWLHRHGGGGANSVSEGMARTGFRK